jgi:hypothetical protein
MAKRNWLFEGNTRCKLAEEKIHPFHGNYVTKIQELTRSEARERKNDCTICTQPHYMHK